jgi:hypothetical protein
LNYYLDLLKDSRAVKKDFDLSNSTYNNLLENSDINNSIDISNEHKKLLKDSFSSASSILTIIDTSIAITSEKGIEMAKFLGEKVIIFIISSNKNFYYYY